MGDSYGLEVETERKDSEDLNNGRCFRERIRSQDSEKTLVGGEWGDQFHVAYIDGVKPVLIQIRCKDDDLAEQNNDEPIHDSESKHENDSRYSKNNFDDKDVYSMYYIEEETSK